MELTQAELIFATTMLHATKIVGFEHLFPTDAAEKDALWQTGREQLLARDILQKQSDGFQLDPTWLYKVAMTVDPEAALLTQRSSPKGSQTVGTYLGDGVAVELMQVGAGAVRLRAVASTELALNRIVSIVRSANNISVTAYHPTVEGLLPQATLQQGDTVSVQALEALLP